MAKVRFIADFDYKPTASSTTGYKAGMVLTVKRECAEQAIAAEKAVAVPLSLQRKSGSNGGG